MFGSIPGVFKLLWRTCRGENIFMNLEERSEGCDVIFV